MPDSEPIASLRRALQDAGRSMLAANLAWGNAGNISARLDPDRILITASGTQLGRLEPTDLVVSSLSGAPSPAQARPSKELPMHRAIYTARLEINAVLHASPFYSTLLACSSFDFPSGWFVESMYFLERVARVPYHHPGSAALGAAVGEHSRTANVLLLENHGVLVYDVNLEQALMALATLEMTARLAVTAASAGIPLHAVPPSVVSDFLQNAGYKPRRVWPE